MCEVCEIAAAVDAGTLEPWKLDDMLRRIEEGPRSLRGKLKLLAAAAIFRQHGGRYVARGMAWCSDDGVNLRGELR